MINLHLGGGDAVAEELQQVAASGGQQEVVGVEHRPAVLGQELLVPPELSALGDPLQLGGDVVHYPLYLHGPRDKILNAETYFVDLSERHGGGAGEAGPGGLVVQRRSGQQGAAAAARALQGRDQGATLSPVGATLAQTVEMPAKQTVKERM